MTAQALEQSVLESKDKTQLIQIAEALGVKTSARNKKADIIGQILAKTGSPAGGSNGDDGVAATDTAAITLDRGLEFALVGSEAVTIATGFGPGYQCPAGDLRGYGLFNRIPSQQLSGMTALRDPQVITDPITGVSLLLGWYGQNARTVYEVSILYGVNVVQSDLLCRVQSSN